MNKSEAELYNILAMIEELSEEVETCRVRELITDTTADLMADLLLVMEAIGKQVKKLNRGVSPFNV